MAEPEHISDLLPRAIEQLAAEWFRKTAEPSEDAEEAGGDHEE